MSSQKSPTLFLDYLGYSVRNLSAYCQPLNKGPCSNESSSDLNLQFPGNISKRLQLVCVLADTLQVVLTEMVLRVYKLEHALQQPSPEVVQHFLQVHIASCVITFQLCEEVLEHLWVLHVQHAIRPDKHVVQGSLRILQQFSEKLCRENKLGLMAIIVRYEGSSCCLPNSS